MPGWLTEDELRQAVLDQLQKSDPDNAAMLEPWWDGLVARANVWAYGECRRRLLARGYTAAQLALWDDGPEFQADLGAWKALTAAAAMAPDQYSLAALECLDRRKELAGSAKDGIGPVAVTVAGAFVDPAGTAGQAATGTLATTADLFVPIDPDDPLIGSPAET